MKYIKRIWELSDLPENTHVLEVREEKSENGNSSILTMNDLVAPKEIHGGRHPLPNMKPFMEKISSLGIRATSPVLLVSRSFILSFRARFMLRLVGVKSPMVLFDLFEGSLPPMTGSFQTEKGGLSLNMNFVRSRKEVFDHLYDPGVQLVDCRDSRRFYGLEDPIDFRPGHIPGAINLFYQELLQKDWSRESLRESFSLLDDTREIVLYCGSGMTATVTSLFMDEVGLSHSIYIGSFSDWISYPDAPLES